MYKAYMIHTDGETMLYLGMANDIGDARWKYSVPDWRTIILE